MVSSMVEIRQQGVRLTGQDKANITPSMVADKTKLTHSTTLKGASLPQGTYSVSKTLVSRPTIPFG